MLISTGIKLYNESNKDNVGEVRVISLALVLIVVFIYYLNIIYRNFQETSYLLKCMSISTEIKLYNASN